MYPSLNLAWAFPKELVLLRRAGYRLDSLEMLERQEVLEWLKLRGIALGPGPALELVLPMVS